MLTQANKQPTKKLLIQNEKYLLKNDFAQVTSENWADIVKRTKILLLLIENEILPFTIWKLRNLLLILKRAQQTTLKKQVLIFV